MTDRQAKNALWTTILVGVALGGIWGQVHYESGLVDIRAWNLVGLAVILSVSSYAGAVALFEFVKSRGARRQ
jgi:hypothetical protein